MIQFALIRSRLYHKAAKGLKSDPEHMSKHACNLEHYLSIPKVNQEVAESG
jgi:hypothetical protein